MIGLVLFVGIAIAILAVGLAIGMLVAGRITRWLDRADEEPDDR
jgi:NhaP-type Na+/H+ or K+/H+ antiporter